MMKLHDEIHRREYVEQVMTFQTQRVWLRQFLHCKNSETSSHWLLSYHLKCQWCLQHLARKVLLESIMLV